MTLRNLPGGIPEPDELFGREETLRTLWSMVKGNNILLLAPRRFGKTGAIGSRR